MNSILEIKNISKTFSDGTHVLNNISFSVTKGEFIVIAGENGSGKTVLMKHLNGLLTPSKGEILLHGKNIKKSLIEARSKIGLIFQNSDTQIIGQTVEEDIAFGPRNLNLNSNLISERIEYALKSTGLSELRNHATHNLSGGEKKRLGIAGILAMRPDILIFDEPFAGLDLKGVQSVLKTIINLHDDKKNIIIITHDLEKVLAHATRLIIMHNGKIEEDDLPSNLLSKLKKYNIKLPYGQNRNVESMTWMN